MAKRTGKNAFRQPHLSQTDKGRSPLPGEAALPYGAFTSRLAGQMYPAQSDIPYLCVVGAQKLVCSGSHGHEMRFALSAFPVNERMHWLVCRGLLSVGVDHLIPCFQQIRGIPLCWRIAMGLMPADRFLIGSMPMKATDALRRGQRRAPPKFTP